MPGRPTRRPPDHRSRDRRTRSRRNSRYAARGSSPCCSRCRNVDAVDLQLQGRRAGPDQTSHAAVADRDAGLAAAGGLLVNQVRAGDEFGIVDIQDAASAGIRGPAKQCQRKGDQGRESCYGSEHGCPGRTYGGTTRGDWPKWPKTAFAKEFRSFFTTNDVNACRNKTGIALENCEETRVSIPLGVMF